MRTNKIIRNTIIGLSTLIGSSNFSPSIGNSAIKKIEKVPARYTQTVKNVNEEVETILKSYFQYPYHANHKPLPLKGVTIMVNAGHGETLANGKIFHGAKASLEGKTIYENDLNDCFSKYESQELEKLGAAIVTVDNTYVPDILVKKLTQKPDLFIADHCDAQTKEAKRKAKRTFSGETIYTLNEKGKQLANYINLKLRADLDIPNNGVHADQDFIVLLDRLKKVTPKGKKITYHNTNNDLYKEQAEIPSVLIEHGYMTCNDNLEKLTTDSYQRKSAKLIAEGIVEYIKSLKPQTTPKYPLTERSTTNIVPFNWLKSANIDNN